MPNLLNNIEFKYNMEMKENKDKPHDYENLFGHHVKMKVEAAKTFIESENQKWTRKENLKRLKDEMNPLVDHVTG